MSFLDRPSALLLVPWLALVGCEAGPADDDASVDDDTAPDDDASGDDDTAPEWSGSFSGTVADFAGTPIADLTVTLCLDVCRFSRTEADGSFAFTGLEPGLYKYDAVAPPSDGEAAWSNVLFPVTIGENEAVELEAPVYLPEVGPPVAITSAGEVALGDGLVLTVDPAELDFPTGGDSPWLAGRRIEPAFWPPFVPDGVELLAVWALAPYDTEVVEGGSPIPVRIEDALGLAPGTAVRFWVLSYDDGGLVDVASGSVSDDGSTIETSPGEGLPRITWVAVSAS